MLPLPCLQEELPLFAVRTESFQVSSKSAFFRHPDDLCNQLALQHEDAFLLQDQLLVLPEKLPAQSEKHLFPNCTRYPSVETQSQNQRLPLSFELMLPDDHSQAYRQDIVHLHYNLPCSLKYLYN